MRKVVWVVLAAVVFGFAAQAEAGLFSRLFGRRGCSSGSCSSSYSSNVQYVPYQSTTTQYVPQVTQYIPQIIQQVPQVIQQAPQQLQQLRHSGVTVQRDWQPMPAVDIQENPGTVLEHVEPDRTESITIPGRRFKIQIPPEPDMELRVVPRSQSFYRGAHNVKPDARQNLIRPLRVPTRRVLC